MAQQTIFLGTNPNDRTGESLRSGGSMINSNFTELYALFSDTINAGAVAYNFAGATKEQRIALAATDAVLLGKSLLYIPNSLLPYDTTLIGGGYTSVKRFREGGDSSHHDILAYGGVGGGHAYDIPSLQAAVNTATVIGGLVFIPSTFDLTAATFAGVTGIFTGENAGGVRMLSGHNPTLSIHGDTNIVPGDDTPWGQLHVYSQIMAVGAPTAGGADLMLVAPKHRSGGPDYDVRIVGQTVNGVRSTGILGIDMDIVVADFTTAPFRGHGLRIRQADNSHVIEFPISGSRILMPGILKGQNGAGNADLVLQIGDTSGAFLVANAAFTQFIFNLSNSGTLNLTGSLVAGGSVHATQRIRSGAVTVTWSTTPNIDALLGTHYLVNATSNIAAVITASNPPAAGFGQVINVEIHNSSGGALGTAPTFNAANFLFSPVMNPANGTGVIYQFAWSATRSKWLEVGTHQTAGL